MEFRLEDVDKCEDGQSFEKYQVKGSFRLLLKIRSYREAKCKRVTRRGLQLIGLVN